MFKPRVWKDSSKSVFLVLWLCIMTQIFLSDLLDRQSSGSKVTSSSASSREQLATGPLGVMFAEAGKKKKKEKSEVVVISVQNSPAKGGMYPIFVPSCGGGHGGYGRRKRSIAYV